MTDDGSPLSPDQAQARALFHSGLREFEGGRYFEAHDLWEELWHELRGPDRLYIQGLIHLAVGMYHRENGNQRGATSQFRKALAKLGRYPSGHWGIDTSRWQQWVREVLDGTTPQDHPRNLPFDRSRFPASLPLAPS